MKENINETIYRFFNNDEDALPQLIAYFRPATIAILFDFLQGRRIDDAKRKDYLNIADETLVNCLHNCRTDQYYSLKAFYKIVYRHRLVDSIRRDRMARFREEYQIVSLDEFVFEEKRHYVSDYVEDRAANVHETVMMDLTNEYVEKHIRAIFSDYECEILLLRQKGYSNTEIAQMFSIPARRVRYILMKIKKWSMSH